MTCVLFCSGPVNQYSIIVEYSQHMLPHDDALPLTSLNICMSKPERQNTFYRFIEPTLQQQKHGTSADFTNRKNTSCSK